MKLKILLSKSLFIVLTIASLRAIALVPVANFSISPIPVCSGNVIQITDLSSNVPTAWSYTIRGGGFGPGGQPTVVTVQNPTITFNGQGTFTIFLVSTNASGSSSIFSQTIAVLAGPNVNINPQNQTTCPGGLPVTIVAFTGGGPGGGGNNTYNWSNGATSSSIIVSPSVTTIYTCVVTSTNGCSVIRTATVSLASPTITVNSVPANICPGSTSTLTALSSGQAPFSYTWSNGSNNSSITSSLAGVYSATVINGLGCSGVTTYSLGTSNTLSLTATANPSAICSGSIASINVTGASTYIWNTGSTSSNYTVNPTSTTTYSVLGSLGTCTGVTTVVLTVSQIPTVVATTNVSSLCSGQSASLNATGATNYTWNPGGLFSSNIVVTPTVTTTYIVRGLNSGCPARNASVTINVLPSPIISIASSTNLVCSGEAVALVASGANNYSWSTGQSAAIILVNPTTTTVYTVTGTNQSNCIGTAAITQSVSDCTALSKLADGNLAFQVYPNPSQGDFYIKCFENTTVGIINQLGQIVYSVELAEKNNYSVSVSGLSNGIYFVKALSDIRSSSHKLIVFH